MFVSDKNRTMDSSDVAVIREHFEDPIEMFQSVLKRFQNNILTMNLATIDSELGVLNRTVIYRGLSEEAVIFVTERNSRKYQNIMDNPMVSLTFYLPTAVSSEGGGGGEDTWQVRLFDATAKELTPEHTQKLWQEESVNAKIRSHICKCGAPVDPVELKKQHDQLLEDYRRGANILPQTESYTAFVATANRWDFFKTQAYKIADRLQYVRKHRDDAWQRRHICA